ncbi:MAG: hypothetical protein ACYSWQ_29040, partial [Planctomycetota bacterium]
MPAYLAGTLILCAQLPQANSMTVELSGTTTTPPHLGHLPFLPECFSSTLMSRVQFEQANLIMICPLLLNRFYLSLALMFVSHFMGPSGD